jgi:hypothetical protein
MIVPFTALHESGIGTYRLITPDGAFTGLLSMLYVH